LLIDMRRQCRLSRHSTDGSFQLRFLRLEFSTEFLSEVTVLTAAIAFRRQKSRISASPNPAERSTVAIHLIAATGPRVSTDSLGLSDDPDCVCLNGRLDVELPTRHHEQLDRDLMTDISADDVNNGHSSFHNVPRKMEWI
jgi:hypothetical protein